MGEAVKTGDRVRRSRRARNPLGWILWRRHAGAPSGCVLTTCVAAIALGLVLWSAIAAGGAPLR